MKKLLLLSTLFALTLTSCGRDDNLITVVATEIPHAEILYEAQAALANEGYRLKVNVINNYALGNPAVSNGSADANYFQHIPYFNLYNESVSDAEALSNVANIHIEPIGLYAGRKNNIAALQDGDKIIISDNAPDYGRIVAFLAELNVVTVVNDFAVTNRYEYPDLAIKAKTVDFTFQIIEAHLLVAAKRNQEGAFIFINGNYALEGGLTRHDVLIEEPTSNNPFVNIVAVKKGHETLPKIVALVTVLTGEEIKNFINTKYNGAVIAV